ncbi:Glycosyl transferase family 2 [Aquimixticola soesokkakensis]|uniref:Glycosyl transferase family 2 n=1 Tax=Aquimixticola soesokkakensis TaxID=1519096 RepID=A0A1Y5REQ7_9RHOB|nr:glycosyltransferase [Aquimixticola soesokkakensis]SLN15403.1 Glycosyl transferase family 2 [Aquimixticola soesokkakensis]
MPDQEAAPESAPATGPVTILLCTFNGAPYLRQQLDSYVAQTHRDWSLWVSDDGSDDDTRAILSAFQTEMQGRNAVHLVAGPKRGFAANYLSLLAHPDLPRQTTFLSDQDDVWLNTKIARAIAALKTSTGPAVYGAGSLHVDRNLVELGTSRPPPERPDFRHALCQNAVSGHSATLNAKGLDLVRRALTPVELARAGTPQGIAFHDWFLYQLFTGTGADVLLDPRAMLLYRQHGGNWIGAHNSLAARLQRIRIVMNSGFGGWMRGQLLALERSRALLTPESAAMVRDLCAAFQRGGTKPLASLLRHGVHRQSATGTFALRLAAATGRL